MPCIVKIKPGLFVVLLAVILGSLKISRKKPQKGHFPPEAHQRKNPGRRKFQRSGEVCPTPYGPNAPQSRKNQIEAVAAGAARMW
jgi:hypothetical protein